MAKVTILITPEEEFEGVGPKVTISQEEVVTLDQLAAVYLSAARAAGWVVDDVGMFTDKGGEFWSA